MPLISTLRPWSRWFAHVGTSRACWRILHEAAARSGARELFEPSGAPLATPLSPLPRELSAKTWLERLGTEHWFSRLHKAVHSGEARRVLETLLSPHEQRALDARARRALDGVILAHGGLELDFGSPRKWRLAPTDPSRREWPLVHGARVLQQSSDLGDIKDVWALGRSLHVFDWVRARSMERDVSSCWSQALADDLATFEAQNPWRAGPHWSSGQECAIRALVWCFGVAVLGQDDGFTQVDFARFVRLLEHHARFIHENLDFARFAVPNNHLIIEAIALAAIGVLFPWLRDAARYRDRGATVLIQEALSQFSSDGDYVQASHNYHRLALEYLLWAARLIPKSLLSPHRLRGIFYRSARSLCMQMHDETRGYLPNWGANDGARMHRFSETEHRDYRPLLASLYRELGEQPPFAPGAWQEAVFWLGGCHDVSDRTVDGGGGAGKTRLPRTTAAIDRPSFDGVSGSEITTLARGDWTVSFRSRPPVGLASQCDLFHVDLWQGEQNVAMDAGSYRYHDQEWHRWFSGAASHNVLHLLSPRGEVLEPVERPAQFAYYAREGMARVISRSQDAVCATHTGWLRHGVRHYTREVLLEERCCRVVDRLLVERDVTICIHWLLEDLGWSIAPSATNDHSNNSFVGEHTEPTKITLEGEHTALHVSLIASGGGAGILRRDVKLIRGLSPQDPRPSSASPRVAGWFSPSYGSKRCATSAMLVCDLSPGAFEFSTEFSTCASR